MTSRLAGLAATVGVMVLLVWALTTPGSYFWPSWVWLGLVIPFAVVRSVRLGLRYRGRQALGVQFAVSAVVVAVRAVQGAAISVIARSAIDS